MFDVGLPNNYDLNTAYRWGRKQKCKDGIKRMVKNWAIVAEVGLVKKVSSN